MRVRGWILGSATTVDHGAKLPFRTRGSISESAHPSCGVETWIGGLVGVTSVPLSRRPSKIPAGSGSMVRRTPLM